VEPRLWDLVYSWRCVDNKLRHLLCAPKQATNGKLSQEEQMFTLSIQHVGQQMTEGLMTMQLGIIGNIGLPLTYF
jgi:hypothetical protein